MRIHYIPIRFANIQNNMKQYGAWGMAQLIRHLTIDFGSIMISWLVRLCPTLGSRLTAWSLLGILSLSLCSSFPHPKISKHLNNKQNPKW